MSYSKFFKKGSKPMQDGKKPMPPKPGQEPDADDKPKRKSIGQRIAEKG